MVTGVFKQLDVSTTDLYTMKKHALGNERIQFEEAEYRDINAFNVVALKNAFITE
jgi:hypothetical protein